MALGAVRVVWLAVRMIVLLLRSAQDNSEAAN